MQLVHTHCVTTHHLLERLGSINPSLVLWVSRALSGPQAGPQRWVGQLLAQAEMCPPEGPGQASVCSLTLKASSPVCKKHLYPPPGPHAAGHVLWSTSAAMSGSGAGRPCPTGQLCRCLTRCSVSSSLEGRRAPKKPLPLTSEHWRSLQAWGWNGLCPGAHAPTWRPPTSTQPCSAGPSTGHRWPLLPPACRGVQCLRLKHPTLTRCSGSPL